MRILQFSSAFPKGRKSFYKDLTQALASAGHAMTVVALDQRAAPEDAALHEEDGFRVLRVRTAPVFGVGKIRKGLSFLSLCARVKRAVRARLSGEEFDCVLFEAPPVMLAPVVRWCMRRFKCPSYLMQKDIFPQNAVDLGFFSKHSPFYFYFRFKERQMLRTATAVGCISPANVAFLRAHNPDIAPKKFELFPNTKPAATPPQKNRGAFCQKYGYAENDCVFLFAGNLGVPQNVGFLCAAMRHFEGHPHVRFLVVGAGTEKKRVENFIAENALKNSRFFNFMPRDDYELVAVNCDVGIISLDPRYTIPNYPSKALSYMEFSMPMIAATDTCTDFRELFEGDAPCGLWSDAAKPEDFYRNVETLAADAALRRRLGENGRRYMEAHFDSARSVRILEDFYARTQTAARTEAHA